MHSSLFLDWLVLGFGCYNNQTIQQSNLSIINLFKKISKIVSLVLLKCLVLIVDYYFRPAILKT